MRDDQLSGWLPWEKQTLLNNLRRRARAMDVTLSQTPICQRLDSECHEARMAKVAVWDLVDNISGRQPSGR